MKRNQHQFTQQKKKRIIDMLEYKQAKNKL